MRKVKCKMNKLAPYRTDGRIIATDVCAKFKITWHKNQDKYNNLARWNLDIVP